MQAKSVQLVTKSWLGKIMKLEKPDFSESWEEERGVCKALKQGRVDSFENNRSY